MLTTGELLVRYVGVNDIQLRFNCHVRRLLNGELITNRQPGKILLFGKYPFWLFCFVVFFGK